MIKKFKIDLGKMDYNETGKYTHPVVLEVELREHDKLKNGELSICGEVWLPSRRDITVGGQCYDSIDPNLLQPEYRELCQEVREVWERWHLNDMRVGNQVQMDALRAAGLFKGSSYEVQSEYLKSEGLYDVNGEKFGHAWYKEELPQEVLELLSKWEKNDAK